MRIGFDIDDVLYPWYHQAHFVCVMAGVAEATSRPWTWHPYEEYGITRERWENILNDAVIDGSLHFGQGPVPGAASAVHHLRRRLERDRPVTFVAITARGETFESSSPWLRTLVRQQTSLWLRRYGFQFDSMVFSTKKGDHELDYLIDDNPGNVRSVIANGGQGYLMTQTWNTDANLPRVHSLAEYAERILEDL